MLDFFRRYQRYFFFFITIIVVSSFTFFGAYSPMEGGVEPTDRVIGQMVDGSKLMLSEVQKLSRFIATDRADFAQGRNGIPNFCNDGVIRNDFVKTGLAELLVSKYFKELKGDLESRVDKARRFRPYAHPQAPFLSAKTIWEHLLPALNGEIAILQKMEAVTPEVFSQLTKLYQLQNQLPSETLRRILIYQHQQYPALPVDQRLSSEDLSLFGFHSAADWFGRDFVDLVAQFILNSAKVAEEKGYRVSLEEAKGDLIHSFQESMKRLSDAKVTHDLNFHQHLRSLGFDERSAAESWRSVLLFRRYFEAVGETAFIDRLPYRDFAGYAKEVAVVQKYEWPINLKNGQDLAQLEFYIKAISPKANGLPTSFFSVEEVEKRFPLLVQSVYRGKVAEVSKREIGLKATVKDVWEWELNHWDQIKSLFSLPFASSREERFHTLERLDPKTRAQVDRFARESIVDQNPAWIEEALANAPLKEKRWSVSGNEEATLKGEGIYYRVENLEKIEEKHILPFAKAKDVLAKEVGLVEGACPQEKNPFLTASKEALSALQKNRQDPRWVQSGSDPLADQFKLVKKEEEIQRNSQENWMKEQAFLMVPDFWSPIHLAEDGKVVFFYLQEKKRGEASILEQLSFGKEILAADAKVYLAERLLDVVKDKKAIVIPVQKESE